MKEFFQKCITFLLGKPKESLAPEGFALHEEFESRRTTRMGMVFVIIMVIGGVWQGQVLFSSIKGSILPPQSLSSCFAQLVYYSGEQIVIPYDSSLGYSPYTYQEVTMPVTPYSPYPKENTCVYNPLETKYDINGLYLSVKPSIDSLSLKQKELSDLQTELYKARSLTNDARGSYDTNLLEEIASPPSSPQSLERQNLSTNEQRVAELNRQIESKQNEIDTLKPSIRERILAKKSDLLSVVTETETLLRWLELKRFLLGLLLLAPLAFFTLRRYGKAKNERSEYAIIWAGVALIAVILFSQLLIVFAYEIIPHQLLQKLFAFLAAFFASFRILLVLVQWVGLILIPLFFGFLVYKIQKKYYNKEAVIMRALKDNKCPQCLMKIKDTMTYCPVCSFTLRATCAKCQMTSVSYAKYCEHCQNPFPSKESKSL